MKIILAAGLGSIIFFTGCDSGAPKTDPLAAEREKLAAERAALDADVTRLAVEQLAAQNAAAEKEARRLNKERAELHAEKLRLAEQSGQLEKERARQAEAEKVREAARKPTESSLEKETTEDRRKAEAHAARMARAEAERQAAKEAAAQRTAEAAKGAAAAKDSAAAKGAVAAGKPRTAAFFHEALEGHGEWLHSDKHGYVWRPLRAVIQNDWRPYADGRWQWTDYGWTWQSQEPYGWAVYHYGRWFRSAALGWLWTPGAEWAPAWVAWRVKGTEYIGWAPLPPEAQEVRSIDGGVDRRYEIGPMSYAFLPTEEFDQPTYVHKFVPPDRQMEVMRGSRNVTQLVAHPTGQGTVIPNGGPDSGRIGSTIRQARNDPDLRPVPRVNLVFANDAGSHKNGDPVEGGAMMLFAPRLEKGASSGAKPRAARDKVALGEVDRGWGDRTFEVEWRGVLEWESHAAAARAAAVRASTKAATAAPKPEPAPAPSAAQRPPSENRRSPLNPAKLQPAPGLFPK